MSESIRDRLDREAEEQKARQSDSMTRVSDSFISGIEHAANIAHRMEQNFIARDAVAAALVAEWKAHRRPGEDEASARLAVNAVASALGINLSDALRSDHRASL